MIWRGLLALSLAALLSSGTLAGVAYAFDWRKPPPPIRASDVIIDYEPLPPMSYAIMADKQLCHGPAKDPLSRGLVRLPLDHRTGFLQGVHLRVPCQGDITWNGQIVDEARLWRYLRELASEAVGEPVFVEFEPGMPPKRADRIRRMIVDGGLCAQRRCGQIDWNVPRPVVY